MIKQLNPNHKFILGEGLFWDHKKNALFGVDIDSSLLWIYNNKSIFQFFKFKRKVSWVIKIKNTDFYLIGNKNQIIYFDINNPNDNLSIITFPDILNSNQRLNDAKADVNGTIWGGVMSESSNDLCDGYLYKVDQNGIISIVDDGYGIPNGPAFSPDGLYMLHTDSRFRKIYIFDYDSTFGIIKNKRVWKYFQPNDGTPDGMCFDSQGCIWIAHWGGGKVCRYDIDGSLMATFFLPTSQVSNLCFGGRDLDRLFVSSASAGLDSNNEVQQDFAGILFEINNTGTFGLFPYLASESLINLLDEN
jgi:D-xylonolactonase